MNTFSKGQLFHVKMRKCENADQCTDNGTKKLLNKFICDVDQHGIKNTVFLSYRDSRDVSNLVEVAHKMDNRRRLVRTITFTLPQWYKKSQTVFAQPSFMFTMTLIDVHNCVA